MSFCLFGVYLAACLLVQSASHAADAGFLTHPDEPSHFVGAAMALDWLKSGQWLTPLQFARDYYSHYPYFAVGYWPPAFHFATAVAMLLLGLGRTAALLAPALFAAGTAWLIFWFAQKRSALIPAFCAGLFYLALPVVQRWYCAVMVDHMTVCLSIAVAAATLRFLQSPSTPTGILIALLSSAAILSKYSSAYVVLLPFAAILVYRRFHLLRTPAFLLQPLLIAVLVGPWAYYTRDLIFYGLPAQKVAFTVQRVLDIPIVTFRIFPVAAWPFLCLGLLALLRKRETRDCGIGLLGLLTFLHCALLFFSPVGAELRYLTLPAAALLVLSLLGWTRLLSAIPAPPGLPAAASALLAVAVLGYFAAVAGDYPRPRRQPIRQTVQAILDTPGPAPKRILVPSDLEGPFIAEFIALSPRRPFDYLLRPGKVLAVSNWFGEHYTSRFSRMQDMAAFLRRSNVDLLVWHPSAGRRQEPHEGTLEQMLLPASGFWRQTRTFRLSGEGSVLRLYVPAAPSR